MDFSDRKALGDRGTRAQTNLVADNGGLDTAESAKGTVAGGQSDCWNLHESITIVWPRNERATTGEIIRNPCTGRPIELPFAISILLGPTDDNGHTPKANHLCDLS